MVQRGRSFGLNEAYLADLYERFLRDPSSVPADLRDLFARWAPPPPEGREAPPSGPPIRAEALPKTALAVQALVEAIRERGHLGADLDPLGLRRRPDPGLEPGAFGLTWADLDALPADLVPSSLAEGAGTAGEAVRRLRARYMGTLGFEFAHLRNPEERAWLYEAVESGRFRPRLNPERKRALLQRLTQVEALERFLQRTFPGQKWFSISGVDALALALDALVDLALASPLEALVFGLSHRGRINLLAHLFGKRYEDILAEFQGGAYAGDGGVEAEGGWLRDVKYHLGARAERPRPTGGALTLLLLPNPSHLEVVYPVALGTARALQDGEAPLHRWDPDRAMAVLTHGDSAFPGQGVVAESLNLMRLRGYDTGGTLHILVNNQVGFTTEPEDATSGLYPTDLARGYDCPVVHINADDPEACLEAVALAFAYRQRWRKDIVLDLVGYRRYGHNEADEPAFTQPRMYEAIRQRPSLRALWAQRLVGEGLIPPEEPQALLEEAERRLRFALRPAPDRRAFLLEAPGPREERERLPLEPTGAPVEDLKALAGHLWRVPEGFRLHPRLERVLARRAEAVQRGEALEWATAEALALATLLREGVSIRLTGQDTERGTFSQRHAVLHDAETGRRWVPLQHLPGAWATFEVYNSPLSELACLAYEYGYTLGSPARLVLWEAQYGDFVNNAQTVVDEYIASGEAKWGQRSGLVLLLPHGYEGQGPNHSHAHLERFLSLCAQGNLRVAYPTTAGQYFHLLRLQARLLKRAPVPLVAFTAKSLLRHPLAMSPLEDLAEGRFRPVLDDPRQPDPRGVRRLILCSGKVYTDLAGLEPASSPEVALVRVELLYPFPEEEVQEVLERYRNAREVVWVQEEPQNRGAWGFVAPRLQGLLRSGQALHYVGRPAQPSPAEGTLPLHLRAQEALLRRAFAPTLTPVGVPEG